MNLLEVVRTYLQPGLDLLPHRMDSFEARLLLLAIGLQESRFLYRRQLPQGPARGWFMFEPIGVRGVLEHPATRPLAHDMAAMLGYESATPQELWAAIQHNDALACVFARLALWRHPDPLPQTAPEGWRYYLEIWRPGKPHEHTWAGFWKDASEAAASSASRLRPAEYGPG